MNDLLDVHSLADGECRGDDLDRATRLADAPAGRRELEAVRALRACLRSKLEQPSVDDAWSQCVRRLDAIDKTRRIESFVGRYAWGLSGILLAALVGTAMLQRTFGAPDVRARDVAMLASGMFPSGESRLLDASRYRQWFQDAFGSQPSESQAWRVSGGVAMTFHGRRMARVNLSDGKGDVSLVMVEDPAAARATTPFTDHVYFCAQTMREMNCVTWEENGFALMVVGDRSTDELHRLADELR
ncbi:MAG: hypothetical protein KIS66_05005 [Fimbriimonadaceae bacterium]|nr:hypothetical protein [Fimbriimonadaceae bacterium]